MSAATHCLNLVDVRVALTNINVGALRQSFAKVGGRCDTFCKRELYAEDVIIVCRIVAENKSITELDLSEVQHAGTFYTSPLRGVHVRESSAEICEMIDQNKQLRVVHLGHAGLGPPGGREIAWRLRHRTAITGSLDDLHSKLEDPDIGQEGGRLLKEKISDAKLELDESPDLSHLRVLNLIGNPFGMPVIDELKDAGRDCMVKVRPPARERPVKLHALEIVTAPDGEDYEGQVTLVREKQDRRSGKSRYEFEVEYRQLRILPWINK